MKDVDQNRRKVVTIVGGGFAGVRTALNLVGRKRLSNLEIVLISDKSHFEYQAALYRVVTGRSPVEVCIPLDEIFRGKAVKLVEDKIENIDLSAKKLRGRSGSEYGYDFLVLALGSETSYYNTPGLKKLSYGFKSIYEAVELKNHLIEQVSKAKSRLSKAGKVKALNIVVVGGGASGTELAGELVAYTEHLARKARVDPSFVTVDLIQSGSHLIPNLPEGVSEKVERRLHSLGVNVFVNRRVVKEELEMVMLKDMELKTKTVIWTAGVVVSGLYKQTRGLKLSESKRVKVDRFLRAKGHKSVYVLGDGAETKFSGMAQTAVAHGKITADNIFRALDGRASKPYDPKDPIYAIPVGRGWAAVLWGSREFYGRLGWILRRLADLRFFLSILSVRKAMLVFWSKGSICKECGICIAS